MSLQSRRLVLLPSEASLSQDGPRRGRHQGDAARRRGCALAATALACFCACFLLIQSHRRAGPRPAAGSGVGKMGKVRDPDVALHAGLALSPWPKLHADARNTARGVAGDAGPNLRWISPTGSHVGSSAAIGADNTVYVGSCDDNLYGLDGASGRQ